MVRTYVGIQNDHTSFVYILPMIQLFPRENEATELNHIILPPTNTSRFKPTQRWKHPDDGTSAPYGSRDHWLTYDFEGIFIDAKVPDGGVIGISEAIHYHSFQWVGVNSCRSRKRHAVLRDDTAVPKPPHLAATEVIFDSGTIQGRLELRMKEVVWLKSQHQSSYYHISPSSKPKDL